MEINAASPPNPIHLFDPRHEGFITGVESRLHDRQVGTHFIVSGFALVCALLGLTILFIGVMVLQTQAALEQHGITVKATILDQTTSILSTNKQGEKTYGYLLVYQFIAGNEHFTATKQVRLESYNQLQKGDSIDIRYLPENPKVSVIVGEADTNFPNMILMGIVFVVGAVIVLSWMLWRMGVNRRLARTGRILEGRITKTEIKRVTFRSGSYLETHYRFMNPAGKEIHNSIATLRTAISSKHAAYWTRIAILYINDRTYRIL